MAEKKASSLSSSAIEPLKKEGGGGPLSSKGDQRGIKPLEGAFFFPLVVREEGNLYQKGWGNVCGRGRRVERRRRRRTLPRATKRAKVIFHLPSCSSSSRHPGPTREGECVAGNTARRRRRRRRPRLFLGWRRWGEACCQ